MTATQDLPKEMAVIFRRKLTYYQLGYYFWFTIYLIIGISAIILPLAAAANIDFGVKVEILALLGGISAAVYGFIKPHEYATAFDSALQTTAAARDSFILGTLSVEKLDEQLRAANEATRFKYTGPGLPANR